MQWQEKVHAPKPTIRHGLLSLVSSIFSLLGMTLFLILLLYQLKTWLETGFWPSLPVRILLVDVLHLSAITDYTSWYNAPTKWFGLHTMAKAFVEDLPLSIFFLVLGKLIAILVDGIAHFIPQSRNKVITMANFK